MILMWSRDVLVIIGHAPLLRRSTVFLLLILVETLHCSTTWYPYVRCVRATTVSVVVQQYTFLVVMADIGPAKNRMRQKEERDLSLFTECLVQNAAAAAAAVKLWGYWYLYYTLCVLLLYVLIVNVLSHKRWRLISVWYSHFFLAHMYDVLECTAVRRTYCSHNVLVLVFTSPRFHSWIYRENMKPS